MNGARYYTYARKNVRFFVLDTTQLDAKQVAWLDAALQEAKEDWKICYFHHPLYSNAGRHGSSVDLRVLLEPIFVKHGVDVVFLENLANRFLVKRLEVNVIGCHLVRHDRSRIRVYQHNLNTLLPQRPGCLRARIIKFTCLADNDRPTTYNQY